MSTTSAAKPASVPALLANELLDLVDRSRAALLEASHSTSASERYSLAYLAALRASAALLSQVAPAVVGSRPRSAWEQVSRHVPELSEWAIFFTQVGRRSRSAQAHIWVPSTREADDLVREAEHFLDAVLMHVGLPACAPVSVRMTPVAVR